MKNKRSAFTIDKPDLITFKVDRALASAMRGVGNRSEFIRTAVLQALDNSCPFCGGAGVLTVAQKKHWAQFMQHHEWRECKACHGRHPVCKPSARSPQKTNKANP